MGEFEHEEFLLGKLHGLKHRPHLLCFRWDKLCWMPGGMILGLLLEVLTCMITVPYPLEVLIEATDYYTQGLPKPPTRRAIYLL